MEKIIPREIKSAMRDRNEPHSEIVEQSPAEKMQRLRKDLFINPEATLMIDERDSPFVIGQDALIDSLVRSGLLKKDLLPDLTKENVLKLDPESLEFSKLGEAIARIGKDRVFIDLGSGAVDRHSGARVMAQLAGCARYIGVDLQPPYRLQEVVTDESPNISRGFENAFIQGDILSFLRNFKVPENGALLLLTCLQPEYGVALHQDISRYTQAVMDEIERIEEHGGGVILGAMLYGEFDDLPARGFKLVATQQDLLDGTERSDDLRIFEKN